MDGGIRERKFISIQWPNSSHASSLVVRNTHRGTRGRLVCCSMWHFATILKNCVVLFISMFNPNAPGLGESGLEGLGWGVWVEESGLRSLGWGVWVGESGVGGSR